MDNQYENTGTETFNITHFIVRLIVGAIVLAITAALTPGFTISGIWPLLLGAVVLAALDYIALRLLGVNATPFGRGITGFILAAVIIYVTQFFVRGFNVTWWGALIGALVNGLVDQLVPENAL